MIPTVRWTTHLVLAAVAVALAFGPAGAGSGPRPGKMPLDEQNRLRISAEDRCPVCAMKVAAHAKFASAIQLVDGRTFYFCGTGCMIRSWMHPEVYLDTEPSQRSLPVVGDYFTGDPLDARQAWWVAGSDVVGPMGPALVPLKDRDRMRVFMQRHGGKATFRLSELDDRRWEAITGKKAVPSP